MMQISRENAERIMCANGWLMHLPSPQRALILEHASLLTFGAGEVVYRYGDPPGGIYGLVCGTVTVNAAPLGSMPRLIHLALPGGWTGEGSFMTGEPRRVELQAQTDTSVMHVPLEAMERMAARDPGIIRAFGMISIFATDLLVRVIHDLQKREADRRIASVLHRMVSSGDATVTLSQDGLGVMANASRKQTNAALQKFAASGWISNGYRSITVRDSVSLRQFGELPAGD